MHGIDRLACQDEFFVNDPLDVKKDYEYALDFFSSAVSPFSVSVSFDFLCTAHAFFPEFLSNHYIFSEICTEFIAFLFLNPSRNRIEPDIILQIKGRKRSAHLSTSLKFCTLTPKIC
jgi:hypothetical protein